MCVAMRVATRVLPTVALAVALLVADAVAPSALLAQRISSASRGMRSSGGSRAHSHSRSRGRVVGHAGDARRVGSLPAVPLAPYPFAPGALATRDHRPGAPRQATFQLALEAGWAAFTIGRLAGGLRVMLPEAFDLVVGYQTLVEWLDDGANEALTLGRAGIGVRAVTDDQLHVRVFAAGRHVQDAIGPLFGAELGAGLEAFFSEMVFSADASLSLLPRAYLGEVRLTFGGMVERMELYLGASLIIVEPYGPGTTVLLGGAFVGWRFWGS
jgi:hypothetical protein